MVKNVYKVKKVSKSGNPYTVICIEFENGYIYENFLTNEQEFILKDVPLLD